MLNGCEKVAQERIQGNEKGHKHNKSTNRSNQLEKLEAAKAA